LLADASGYSLASSFEEGADIVTASAQCPGEPDVVGLATRKRGAALEDAILDAAYAELSEVGYLGLSVEAVAARARTGKASIYRRWPTKQELVLDALCAGLPSPQQCGMAPMDLGDMTTVQALHEIAKAISRVLDSPAGEAMRAVKCESATDPELARAIDERFQEPRRQAIMELLARGVARGEVRPDAACQLVADVIPAVLTHRMIVQRERVTESDLTEMMDRVIVPLIEAR
jgi:AcrR family transcriptional regulator